MDTVYNVIVDEFHTYHIGELGVWVHNADCFTGVAKSSSWVSPIQGIKCPGLRDHYAKHRTQVGAKLVKEYDISARTTIQNGSKFQYKDPATNQPRIGYFDSTTSFFTATSATIVEEI